MSFSRLTFLTTTRASKLTDPRQSPRCSYSERRSSTYRRQTLNAPMTFSTPGGIAVNTLQRLKVDPRENRTLETRKRYASDIVQFLTTRNFAADIKMLMTPTGAQFVSIFKFLVHELDPAVAFEVKGKTFNDLVVPTLKGLGYPFADSITKSHLQAAGSQQSWPNMLAMLHWLVFTIEVRLSFPFSFLFLFVLFLLTSPPRTLARRTSTSLSDPIPSYKCQLSKWQRRTNKTCCNMLGSISLRKVMLDSSRVMIGRETKRRNTSMRGWVSEVFAEKGGLKWEANECVALLCRRVET